MSIDAGVFQGWFGTTDVEWFRFLRARCPLDEVNFWSPSDRLPFRRLAPGTPFFFKLKSPYNAVGGYGFFAHGSVLPLRLAWDAFAEKNGTSSMDALVKRIARYRGDLTPGPYAGSVNIGCLMVSTPVFFEDDEFVPQPVDWPKQAVRGKAISLEHGEGLRVWAACQRRAAARLGGHRIAEPDVPASADRYGRPVLVRPRLGQGTFRAAVLDAYGRRCAITAEHSLPVLDAAHIRPYSDGGEHVLSNGLVLRADIHRLFDDGYVGVDADGHFRVSSQLRREWENGRVYYDMEGRELLRPGNPEFYPDPAALEWHMIHRFRT